MSFHSGVKTVFYPYIKITLGEGETAFSLTTSSGTRPDFFISLEHKRYTDKANTITINLQFVPHNGDGNYIADPNYIENAIRNQNICTIQYGISIDTQLSATYRGVIYDYSTTISESGLSYSILAVSSTVVANFDIIQDDSNSIWFEGDEDGKVTTSADEVLEKMKNVVANSALNETCEFDKENSANDFEVTKSVRCSGYNPMQYLQVIANSISCKENTDTSTNKHYYHIVTIDSGAKSQIRLIKSGRVDYGKYVFKWGSRDSDVISWKPEYKGVYTIFGPGGKSRGDSTPWKNAQGAFTKDTEGNVGGYQYETYTYSMDKETSGLIADLAGEVDLESSMTIATKDIQKYKEYIQYPYKATLVVLGVGDSANELVLGQSALRVVPIINGKRHHSAGTYIIVGITDKVDSSSGFTTTFDLVKYVEAKDSDADVTNVLSTGQAHTQGIGASH